MSSWINGNLQGNLSIGQGERGKSIEYEWRGTELGIKQEGEEEYQFVDLAGSGAGSSREIELQVGNGYIQWRYKEGEEWNNLISIDSLKGGKGDKGEQGERGPQGEQGPKGETGPQGPIGEQGLQGLPGKDGADGKSLEFNWNGTELGVKQEGQLSYSYVNLKGQDGRDGVDGNDGTNGKDGVTPNIQVGTVTTLEAGQQATVVKRGTIENPIFDFAIPQGQRGNDGADGITPDMTEFKNQINVKYDTIEKKVDDHINNPPSGGDSCDYKKIVDFTDFKNKQFYPTAYDSTTGIFTCANHGITKYTGIIFKLKNNYKQMTELATLSSLLNGKTNLQILSVDANSFKIRYGYNDSNIVTGDLGIDINELFLEDFTSIASYSFEALGENITHLKGILNCGIPSNIPHITNDTLKSTVGENNGFSNFVAGLYPNGMPNQKTIDGYCDLEFDFKLSNDKKTMYCSHTLSFYYIENGTVKKGRNENFAIIHPSKDKPLFSLDNITFNMSFCNGSRIRLYEIGGE